MIEYSNVPKIGDVYVYNTDKFKSESLSVYFSTPSEKEKTVAKNLLLSVLKRGTEKYPSQKLLNKRLDELYATIVSLKNQRFDSTHLFGLNADVINSDYTDGGEDILDGVLDVMVQILFFPILDDGSFCEEYVSSEKKNYKDTILSQINDPRSYAALRCREETLGDSGDSYKLSEICNMTDEITVKYLSSYYRDFIRNSKLVIFYVGTKNIAEITGIIKNKIPHRNIIFGNEKSVAGTKLENCETKYITEERDVAQARLSMGINANVNWFDSDVYSMMLCNEILGVSGISKLMMNVREKLSLCYECSSAYDMKRGVIYINSGIDSSNFYMAKSAILEQIEDLKMGKISPDELIAAKKSIKNSYRAVFDSPAAIERVFIGRILSGIDCNIDNVIKAVDSSDVGDVVRAANKLSLDTVYFLDGKCSGDGGEEDDE